MMKKLILMMMSLISTIGFAQTDAAALMNDTTTQMNNTAVVMKFGYLSYDSVMNGLADYAKMKKDMEVMTQEYEAEMTRVENDFNKKYEDFLDGQASFPKTILQKRQSELQEMLDKNIAFKKESQQLLKKTEAEMLDSIKAFIDRAVSLLAKEKGYAFVLNTDEKAVTYINPAMGEDITEEVKSLINN